MISSTLFFNLVMGIIGALQVFGQAYIITEGGPNNASLFYVYNLWRQAFKYMDMGKASAMAWILFLVVLVLTAFVTGKAGYGDGIVLCCLGMAMGWEKSILLFGISLFLICLCALVLLAMRRVGKNTSLPFLPFLAVAWIIVASL